MNRLEYIRSVDTAMVQLDTSKICNGVGSKLAILRIFRCPPDVSALFEGAADWHDVAYHLGGDGEAKMYADTEFFCQMMQMVYDMDVGFFARLRLRFWAYLAYTAVRIGGEFAFNWES